MSAINYNQRIEVRLLHKLGKLVRRTCSFLSIEVVSPALAASDNEYIHSLMVLTRRIQRCVRNQFSPTGGSSMQMCGSNTAVEDRSTVFAQPEVTADLDRRLE